MMSLAAAAELLSPLFVAFLLTFCRIGAAFMMFPAFTDHVPPQSRLVAALAVSLPVSVAFGAGAAPAGPVALVLAIMTNVVFGAWLGTVARLLLASLQIAGQIAGQATGLYNPFVSSGLAFEGSTVISTIMITAGTALIFAADLHVHFIAAVANTFVSVPLYATTDIPALGSGIVSAVSSAFSLGVQFSAPFIVLGLVFNLALGACNRLMQAFPVFFVFSPAMIMLGLLLMLLVFGSVAAAFVSAMSALISTL